jgi:hypothetical protein
LLVPSPEDHLRLCAIHLFRHGGWRPLWLCDVATMSEAAGTDFNWDTCLGDNPAAASWTAVAVMLAHRLLGARSDHLPARVRQQCVPEWLENTLLRQWTYPHAGHVKPIPFDFRDLAASLRSRWPDPVTARIWGGGLPGPGPHVHWQIRHFAWARFHSLRRKLRPL